ncbi:MAG: hydrogenase maturation nickel metallochaperone HypA [Solirubrobacteraceae bacterium]
MHELSVATAVLNTALKHADDRLVTGVTVRLGAMRQVVPDSLSFYFDIVARDTACEGATLTLEQIETLLRCDGCNRQWSPEIPAFRCPDCGSADVTVLTGEELEVDYIEVEQREAACIE